MNHLTDDELFRLAEITNEYFSYDENELKMMEHLKSCKECYDKFCSTLVLVEVTSDEGYMTLSELYSMSYADSSVQMLANQVLAVVGVVKQQVTDGIKLILEQFKKKDAVFCFEPALAMGTRGSASAESNTYKMEDVEDEKTFMLLDSQNKEVLLQINTKDLDFEEIKVFIVLDSGEKTEIKLDKKGKLLKGIIRDVTSDNFKIIIEGING